MPYFPMDTWPTLERRSPAVISRLLAFLEQRGVLGTFFIVGWLAEREPDMVRAISSAGHEVASHGYEHELVGRLGQEGFANSLRRTKDVLEDITGRAVLGYRAPSFSIVPGLEWAFDSLLETGHRYDASLFPVSQHPTYGYPESEADPYWIERDAGRLAEFPATTATVFGTKLPASGGAYFRVLPYALVRSGLRQSSARSASGMFYIHPWEMDDWVPDVDAPKVAMVRSFHGRRRVWPRLDRLFSDFRFRPIERTLTTMLRPGA